MKSLKYLLTIILTFLFFVSIARAQVGSYGADSLLDVGCWNLEWFGSTEYGPTNEALQFDNIKQVLSNTDIDLWGFCEMSSNATYDQLLSELPQYNGVQSVYNQTQKTGLLYKSELFEEISSGPILTGLNYNYQFAGRPPLEVVLKTKTLPIADTLYVLVIHLKAYADEESYERRKAAVLTLKNNYLDVYRANKKTVVLGDWNDDLDESIVTGFSTPFQVLLDDSLHYFFPTKALSDGGKTSYAFYTGSFLDHQLVTAPLKNDYVLHSAKVLDELPWYISNFSQNTSDHYPVITSYRWKDASLRIDSPTQLVADIMVSADQTKLVVKGDWQGRIVVYSLTGQKILDEVKELTDLEIAIDSFQKGMYVAMMSGEMGEKRVRFVR